METVTSPAPNVGWTDDQKRRVALAIITCVAIFVAAFLIAKFGLWLGQLVAQYYWSQRAALPPEALDSSKPFVRKTAENVVLLKVLGVGAAGFTVKLLLDLVQWIPSYVQPVLDLVEKGVPDSPLPLKQVFREAFKGLTASWKALSAVFAAAFSLNLAIGTLQPDLLVKPQGNNTFFISSGMSSLFFQLPPTTPPESLSGRAFVVLFEEERSEVKSPEQFANGLTFTNQSTEDFLKLLATRLSYCNEGDRRVVVTIRGFASSSNFKDMDANNSDQLNRTLAYARARKVKETLEQVEVKAKTGALLPKSTFIAYDWKDFNEMAAQRGYEDRVSSVYSEERGQLNRRAEIILDNAGACFR